MLEHCFFLPGSSLLTLNLQDVTGFLDAQRVSDRAGVVSLVRRVHVEKRQDAVELVERHVFVHAQLGAVLPPASGEYGAGGLAG